MIPHWLIVVANVAVTVFVPALTFLAKKVCWLHEVFHAVRGPAATYWLPRVSATVTAPLLLQTTVTTTRSPARLALVKARLFVWPLFTSLARAWTNAGTAAWAGDAAGTTATIAPSKSPNTTPARTRIISPSIEMEGRTHPE